MADTLVFKDYLPANARVLVDYDKPPKERVAFTYPESMSYEKALWKFGLATFSDFSMVLAVMLFILSFIGTFGFLVSYYAVQLIQYPHLLSSSIATSLLSTLEIEIPMSFIICYSLWRILPWFLTWYYGKDKEKLSQIVPKLNYWTELAFSFGRRNYIEFSPKDLTNNWVMIPEFHNVYLDYHATGGMSDELKKVEVIEYPFNYYRKNSKGRLSNKKINHYVFRGRFVFSEKPKSGKLKVEFI